MKNKFLSLILLFIGFFSYIPINAQESVVLGFDPNVPPMGFTDQDGNYVGFDLDLAKEIFESQNISKKWN